MSPFPTLPTQVMLILLCPTPPRHTGAPISPGCSRSKSKLIQTTCFGIHRAHLLPRRSLCDKPPDLLHSELRWAVISTHFVKSFRSIVIKLWLNQQDNILPFNSSYLYLYSFSLSCFAAHSSLWRDVHSQRSAHISRCNFSEHPEHIPAFWWSRSSGIPMMPIFRARKTRPVQRSRWENGTPNSSQRSIRPKRMQLHIIHMWYVCTHILRVLSIA